MLAPLDGGGATEGLGALALQEEEEELDQHLGNLTIRLRGWPRDEGQVLACTGQTLWRGGETLAKWCWRRELKGTCIEVGAGLGLCSLVVERTASAVVATDGDELALSALRRNVALNSARVAVRRLVWGDTVEARRLVTEFDGFDVVLGADVVYDERALGPLVATVGALLKRTGIFVLAFTHRGVNIECLLDWTCSAGFDMEDQTPDDANPLDRLLLFRRSLNPKNQR